MEGKIPFLKPQAVLVYKLLLQEPLTVRQIALKLKVFPHGLYRAIRQLEQYGLISHTEKHPAKYQATPFLESIEAFLIQLRHDLIENFAGFSGSKKEKPQAISEAPDISFIQGRNMSIARSTEDLKSSKDEVEMIVSGNEVPAETIFECKKAIERGVKIKFLVQENKESNKEMLNNWKRLGLIVKTVKQIGIRIFIYDSSIVYISSYQPNKKTEAFGVRFKYQPIAIIMKQIFEKYWQEATDSVSN